MSQPEYQFRWYGELKTGVSAAAAAKHIAREFSIDPTDVMAIIQQDDLLFEKHLNAFQLRAYESLFDSVGAIFQVRQQDQASAIPEENAAEDKPTAISVFVLQCYKLALLAMVVGGVADKLLNYISVDASIFAYVPGFILLVIGNFFWADEREERLWLKLASISGFIGFGLLLLTPNQHQAGAAGSQQLLGLASLAAAVFVIATYLTTGAAVSTYVDQPAHPLMERYQYPDGSMLSAPKDVEALSTHVATRIDAAFLLINKHDLSLSDKRDLSRAMVDTFEQWAMLMNYQAYVYRQEQLIAPDYLAPLFLNTHNLERQKYQFYRQIDTQRERLDDLQFTDALAIDFGAISVDPIDQLTLAERKPTDASHFNRVAFKLSSTLHQSDSYTPTRMAPKLFMASSNRKPQKKKDNSQPRVAVDDLPNRAGFPDGTYENWQMVQEGNMLTFSLRGSFDRRKAVYLMHRWPKVEGRRMRNSGYAHFSRVGGLLPNRLFAQGGAFELFGHAMFEKYE
ncbi:Uncharacterised protein [BD1-7 clade bacterium]|uniref:Uncharacterized protein n=1 Tax=BD1-7 clade bacterium TaxID=2029982 RepID=A0A5S9PIT8_9GAMM|nr:Uncharacterised protein [BD1-7 clade bacterium]